MIFDPARHTNEKSSERKFAAPWLGTLPRYFAKLLLTG